MLIIPIEGDNPTKHTHITLWLIIALCVLIALGPLFSGDRNIFISQAFVPASPTIDSIFSSMFIHAGFLHLLGNMFFLCMFGDNVEDVLGHLIFLISYLACGAAATLGYAWLHPDSQVPLVGASGAVSGILGMYLMFFPRAAAKLSFFFFYRQVHSIKTVIWIALGSWFAIQLVFAYWFELKGSGDGIRIAFSAHIAGFASGLLLGAIFVGIGCMRNYVSRRKPHWLFGYCLSR